MFPHLYSQLPPVLPSFMVNGDPFIFTVIGFCCAAIILGWRNF